MIEMKLQPQPFEMIKSGKKTSEYRVFDEKRRNLCVGDHIRFRKFPDLEEVLLTEIVSLDIYPDFESLFQSEQDVFPHTTVREQAKEMRRYYSKEEEEKYGVVKIGIRIVAKEE